MQDNSHSTSSRGKKNLLRKACDTDFRYQCEWSDCTHESTSMNEFNHHVGLHRRDYTRHLDQGDGEEEFIFYCQWRDCHAQIEGKPEEFARHVYYHTFHQYLKFLGYHIQEVEGMAACGLGSSSRNLIPELPEKLMCRWQDCNLVYDNPYIFYSHVAHHSEDVPKEKSANEPVLCRWEGCKTVIKSWYKLREHMRSHTQAKVVACPTCGSLFANNTRFIDHLTRQRQSGPSFVCSNCGAKFASERLLRDHMRRHVNHYKCPLCDMTCPSPSAVRDHVRYRHSEERVFHCHACHHKAKTSTDLRIHYLHCTIQSEHRKEKSTKRRDSGRRNLEPVGEEEGDDDDNGDEEEEEGSGDFEEDEQEEEDEEDHEKILKNKKRQNKGNMNKENEKLPRTKQGQRQDGEPLFQCHVCKETFTRGAYLTDHLMEKHCYSWPSGHRRFHYKLHEDGFRRLQTFRFESIEVSQQLLGQKLSPPRPAALDGDEDEENDDDDDGDGVDDEASQHQPELAVEKRRRDQRRTAEKKQTRKTCKAKKTRLRSGTRKQEMMGKLHRDENVHHVDIDKVAPSNQAQEGRNKKGCNINLGSQANESSRRESRGATQTEKARQMPGRGCKRKRESSDNSEGNDNSSDPWHKPVEARPATRRQAAALLSSCKTDSSPSTQAKTKEGAKAKVIVPKVRIISGSDPSVIGKVGGKKQAVARSQRLSMPSMADLSALTASTPGEKSDQSPVTSHGSASSTCHKPTLRVRTSAIQTHQSKSSQSTSASLPNCVAENSHTTREPLPAGFKAPEEGRGGGVSTRSSRRKSAARSLTSPQKSGSPAAPACAVSASPAAGGEAAQLERTSEHCNPQTSPVHTSSTSCTPTWPAPASVDSESMMDESELTSAGATPYYGTDTDFSEYTADSPGSSTSVYAINPQYVMQLQQQQQHHQQQQQRELQQQTDAVKTKTSCVASDDSADTDSLVPSSSYRLPGHISSDPHSLPKDEAISNWSALLTQVEICREEEEEEESESSPGGFAEVIVRSGPSLTSADTCENRNTNTFVSAIKPTRDSHRHPTVTQPALVSCSSWQVTDSPPRATPQSPAEVRFLHKGSPIKLDSSPLSTHHHELSRTRLSSSSSASPCTQSIKSETRTSSSDEAAKRPSTLDLTNALIQALSMHIKEESLTTADTSTSTEGDHPEAVSTTRTCVTSGDVSSADRKGTPPHPTPSAVHPVCPTSVASTSTSTGFVSPQKVVLRSPHKSMFPSPEKSLFTIGWALGAGLSPVKQEWRPQPVPEGSVAPHEPSQANNPLGCDATGQGTSVAHNGALLSGRADSLQEVDTSHSASTEYCDDDAYKFETLQAVSSITTARDSGTIYNRAQPLPPGAASLTSATVVDESEHQALTAPSTVVGHSGNGGQSGGEVYQLIEGPNGEYQVVGLTYADLCTLVSASGKSVGAAPLSDCVGLGTDGQGEVGDDPSSTSVRGIIYQNLTDLNCCCVAETEEWCRENTTSTVTEEWCRENTTSTVTEEWCRENTTSTVTEEWCRENTTSTVTLAANAVSGGENTTSTVTLAANAVSGGENTTSTVTLAANAVSGGENTTSTVTLAANAVSGGEHTIVSQDSVDTEDKPATGQTSAVGHAIQDQTNPESDVKNVLPSDDADQTQALDLSGFAAVGVAEFCTAKRCEVRHPQNVTEQELGDAGVGQQDSTNTGKHVTDGGSASTASGDNSCNEAGQFESSPTTDPSSGSVPADSVRLLGDPTTRSFDGPACDDDDTNTDKAATVIATADEDDGEDDRSTSGSSDRCSNTVDERDSGTLYNLQMLGEVALGSETSHYTVRGDVSTDKLLKDVS